MADDAMGWLGPNGCSTDAIPQRADGAADELRVAGHEARDISFWDPSSIRADISERIEFSGVSIARVLNYGGNLGTASDQP